MKVLVGVVLLWSVALASGSRTSIDHLEIEEIASIMCRDGSTWHSKKTIENVATIRGLLAFFRLSNLPSENGATRCRDLYLKSIESLASVLDTNHHDVCSKEKVDEIYKFHWDYVMRTLSSRWTKVSGNDKRLPEMLRLFFMNYANEVANRCEDTLKDRLESAVGQTDVQVEELFSTIFTTSIDRMSTALVPRERVANYDSFMLIWNQVLAKERKEGHNYEEAIDVADEVSYRIVRMKEPKDVWRVQEICRQKLRPVYQNTVLTLMRLIDLGYGTLDEKTAKQVKATKSIRDWYSITQLCELAIPISFYRDKSLKDDERIIVKSKEELEGLGLPYDVSSSEKVVRNIYVEPIQLEKTISSTGDQTIVKQVKANLEARNNMSKMILKNVVSTMKSQLKQKWKNLPFWRKQKGNSISDGEDRSGKTHDVVD